MSSHSLRLLASLRHRVSAPRLQCAVGFNEVHLLSQIVHFVSTMSLLFLEFHFRSIHHQSYSSFSSVSFCVLLASAGADYLRRWDYSFFFSYFYLYFLSSFSLKNENVTLLAHSHKDSSTLSLRTLETNNLLRYA